MSLLFSNAVSLENTTVIAADPAEFLVQPAFSACFPTQSSDEAPLPCQGGWRVSSCCEKWLLIRVCAIQNWESPGLRLCVYIPKRTWCNSLNCQLVLKKFWTAMSVHITPALCLWGRDMFGEQEQLFCWLEVRAENFVL